MSMKQATLSERLRYCAKKVGSGNELSRLTEVSRRALENWLNGTREPKASALVLIAEKSMVSIEWLLTGKGEPEKKEPKIKLVHEKQEVNVSKELFLKVRKAIMDVRKEYGVRLHVSEFDWLFGYISDKASNIATVAENEEQEDLLIKMLIIEEQNNFKNPGHATVSDETA